MQKYVRTLFDQKKSYSSGGKSTIDLPLDRYLSEVILRANVKDYNTAASPTKAEDGVLNLIAKINLRVNGKVIRSWDPARYWYKIPLDMTVKPELADITTTVANDKTASFELPIFFRLDPQNEEDVSALLPNVHLSSVKLEIEWGKDADLGTNQTVDDAEVVCTLKEFELSPGEEIDFYGVSGQAVTSARAGSSLLLIVESETTKDVAAAAGNFGFQMDLPMGAVLRRTLIFARSAGARSDALVDDYRIRQHSPVRIDHEEVDWETSQARDLREYLVAAPIEGDRYLTGFTVADYQDLGLLDVRARKQGDIKFEASVQAPSGTTDITLLNEEIQAIAF